VRRAAQRQLRARQAEPVGGAVGHQRHRLERLRRRAPEGDQVGIARARHEPARPVDHGDVDAVTGLDDGAAAEFDEHETSKKGADG
jgi:hypothetical protein